MVKELGLTFDELARMLDRDCDIQTFYGPALKGVRIRTDKGDYYVAAAWLDEQKNLVLDMGLPVREKVKHGAL